ncbi:hypothetical protein BKA64DRAFT_103646 [Cadophora sp. MPI-SDFR-AT-0126]|nr:hypothetical protein BKA64DRAFT_103646 [Leotiomycetes sp. MPI-SDFR-AT-0126]
MSSQSGEDDLWANLPPLHTIKPEELIRYQIVDWDANNPHHPRYLAGHILIKSLFRRNHYYWIACSNPLPKDNTKKAPPTITVSPPASAPTPTLSAAQSSDSSDFEATTTRPGIQEQQTVIPPASPSNTTTVVDSTPAKNDVPVIGKNTGSDSPSGIYNTTPPDTIPVRPIVAASSSADPIHHLSFGSPTTSSSVNNQNERPNESSSPASPPSASASSKKRNLTSKEQEGRNVRPGPTKSPLKVDGYAEKPADGWLNLGTFSWHYQSP